MNKEKEFNDILDVCLERLARGDTLEQCLASYPDQTTQLEPLLQTAILARAAVAITPRPEFKTQSMYQLSEALRETRSGGAFSFLSFMPRWAVAISAFLVFVMVGSGTIVAAGNSMPDNFLYPVKLATERVQLTFATSDLSKARLYATLADRRVTEIINMVESGKPEKIAGTAERLDELLVSIAGTPIDPQMALMKAPDGVAPPAMTETAPDAASAPAPTFGTEPAPELETAPVPESPAAGEDADIGRAPRTPDMEERAGSDVLPISPEQAMLIELLRRYQIDHPEKLRAVLENVSPSLRLLLMDIINHSQASYQQALQAWETPDN